MSAALAPSGKLPMLPRLSIGSLGRSKRSTASLIADTQFCLTTSGTAALLLALKASGVSPGDEVLLPAYHCVAMLAPIRDLGATPVFFPVASDLTIMMKELRACITPKTRAVVVVHYFGFIQNLSEIRALCDAAGMALIEDCAHAYYGSRDGISVGRTGDFAIGSLVKFFPIFEGGCLVSYRRKVSTAHAPAKGLAYELKATLNVLERSALWSKSSLYKSSIKLLSKLREVVMPAASDTEQASDNQPPAEAAVFASVPVGRLSASSEIIWRLSRHERAVKRRRTLYNAYLTKLGDIVGGKPLYPALPHDCVPYVFPFVLDDPEKSFAALKLAGVPMYRWEIVAEDACETTRSYVRRLVQFPCHQELDDTDIAWLMAAIAAALGNNPTISKSS